MKCTKCKRTFTGPLPFDWRAIKQKGRAGEEKELYYCPQHWHKCALCDKIFGGRTPPGWKNWEGSYYSPDCWGKDHVIRATTMTVVEPLDGWEWKDVDKALKELWQLTTNCS